MAGGRGQVCDASEMVRNGTAKNVNARLTLSRSVVTGLESSGVLYTDLPFCRLPETYILSRVASPSRRIYLTLRAPRYIRQPTLTRTSDRQKQTGRVPRSRPPKPARGR